uniref:Uncharacterized protein n=1 Tax=Arundo donax TaxID=35708 RepID=A0A0A9GFY8_ARUDO
MLTKPRTYFIPSFAGPASGFVYLAIQ